MKIGVMQPYLFPYIGYFQLINCVDVFVIYDNIEYTKKGWINRNRILSNNKADSFTIPLKKASDYSHIVKRELADNYVKETIKIINKIENSYRKAPYFDAVFPILKSILLNDKVNLFEYIYFSLIELLKLLEINTKIVVSSDVAINHSLKSQDKVIEICKKLKADIYVNPIGGVELYSKESFKTKNIDLVFLQSNPISYKQFSIDFIPWLSIIDVLMFNSKKEIKNYLNNYALH